MRKARRRLPARRRERQALRPPLTPCARHDVDDEVVVQSRAGADRRRLYQIGRREIGREEAGQIALRKFRGETHNGARWSLVQPHSGDAMRVVPVDNGDARDLVAERGARPLEVGTVASVLLTGEEERRVEWA